MPGYVGELARRLARDAEAVCREYLSNGRRVGRYWLVGDVKNTPGRSMYVRLSGPHSGKGAAGKWTDAATGEHGDLLDVIGHVCGLDDFHDVEAEARRFLSLPRPQPGPHREFRLAPVPAGSARPSSSVFQAAQCGQRPSHLGLVPPQAVQVKTVLGAAIGPLSPRSRRAARRRRRDSRPGFPRRGRAPGLTMPA